MLCSCPSVDQVGYFLHRPGNRYLKAISFDDVQDQAESDVIQLLVCPRCGVLRTMMNQSMRAEFSRIDYRTLFADGIDGLLRFERVDDYSLPAIHIQEIKHGRMIYGFATPTFIKSYTAPEGMTPRYFYRTRMQIAPDVEPIRRLPGTTLPGEESLIT